MSNSVAGEQFLPENHLREVLDTKDAEIERLKAENKAWQNQDLLEQCNRQGDYIERLRAALVTFGRHKESCIILDPFDLRSGCNCGFTEALKEKKDE